MIGIDANFRKQTLKTQLNISGVYTIHYFRYGKNFRYKEEKHNFYEFVYIDSGNAIIKSNDNLIKLSQGQGFLHKPNSYHTIYTDNDFANSAIISFECKNKELLSLCDKILQLSKDEKSLLSKVVNEAKISFSDRLDHLDLTKMTKRPFAPYGGEQIIKNCTELLFLSLLRNLQSNHKNNSPVVNGLYSPLVEEIMSLLKKKVNSGKQVSLEEISFETTYSKSHIKTLFKQETGTSVLQFYIDLKIEKAKQLLSRQDKTINEISDVLGFTSVQYFCRQFKMRTDMTPSAYINSIKADHLL